MHYSIMFDRVIEEVGCMEYIKHNIVFADMGVFIFESH